MLISQGWVQSEITVQTLYIIKKTKTKEGGGKDPKFSKVLENWRNSKWIFQGIN